MVLTTDHDIDWQNDYSIIISLPAEMHHLNYIIIDYYKFWLQSIHSYSDTMTPVILVGTHDEKMSKQVSLIYYSLGR